MRIVICLLAAIAAPAQTFTTLANFNGTNGANPYFMSLVQGPDGNLYGTTQAGGANNYGAIFKVSPAGKVITLHSFSFTDGAGPSAGLFLAGNGKFYGTTTFGGTDNDGTVFSVAPSGKFTNLYNFKGSDGNYPYAALIQGADGDFYGTTAGGGAHEGGTIFKITPTGTLTSLYSFCTQAACADGGLPYTGLLLSANGSFYGVTAFGGTPYNNGVVFQYTPGATVTVLYTFTIGIFLGVSEGAQPYGALVVGPDGDFYGTTENGGSNGVTVDVNDGMLYKITYEGFQTNLFSFDGTNGAYPFAGMILASDGNFYGTTALGGTHGRGAIYQLTSAGAVNTLHSFDGEDGAVPYGGLVQGTDGNLYGTTFAGGAHGYGTIFSLSIAGR